MSLWCALKEGSVVVWLLPLLLPLLSLLLQVLVLAGSRKGNNR